MPPVTQVFIFTFGAVIGSFLNAVTWRLRTKESFIRGRSYCPQCRHDLAAVDLVPIVSYLLLGGRCRYCRRPISPHYPAVEAAVGLLFLLSALSLAPDGFLAPATFGRLLLDWYLISVLVLVFMQDLKYLTIYPSVVLPAAGAAFLADLALGVEPWRPIAGAVAVAGFFWLQFVVSRGRWIGGGDIYLGVLIGAMLGWPAAFLALLLAYVSGALVGVVLLAMKKKTLGSQLPFGTFLSAAAVAVMLYGAAAMEWYLGLMT